MKTSDFKVGAFISYKVCQSLYHGVIVKVNTKTLIIIDDVYGKELYDAGCAVGSEIAFSQVMSILDLGEYLSK